MTPSVTENYAYLTGFIRDSTYGMAIVDVSNPTNPKLAGSCKRDNVGSVTVAGSYAYIDGNTEILVVDISDPTAPEEVGTHTFDGSNVISSIVAASSYLIRWAGMAERRVRCSRYSRFPIPER